jgi:hypothetical protein
MFLLWCEPVNNGCRQEGCLMECVYAVRRGCVVSDCAIECVPAALWLSSACCVSCSLFCWVADAFCRRYDASIRLSALALTTRERFVGSTSYRSQSRSSLPDMYSHLHNRLPFFLRATQLCSQRTPCGSWHELYQIHLSLTRTTLAPPG